MYMDNNNALKIIKILADGIDPTTGEVFEVNSPYQHPQIIRALFAAISVMERAEDRATRAQSLPANAGKPWSAEEDSNLLASFRVGMTIKELAAKHERTRGSIQSRLQSHGVIESRS